MDIKITSLNCYGFKSSYDFIDNNILKDTQIMFLCETWIRPSEIGMFTERYTRHDMNCHFTSSIDAEKLLKGRPFGGIGFIYKKMKDVSYKTIVHSDRIMTLEIFCDRKLL